MNVEHREQDELDVPESAEVSAFGAGRVPHGARHALGVPAPRNPVRQGTRAALLLFSWAVALEILALIGVRLSSDPVENAWSVFSSLGLYLLLFWPLVAAGVSLYLPRAARPTFWSTTVLLVFLAAILWGLTCVVAGTPRVTG